MAFSFANVVFARPPSFKPPINSKIIQNGGRFQLTLDLEVYAVGNKSWQGNTCSACADTLKNVNAIYLNDITVGILCYSKTVRRTNGTVKVTYFDLLKGRTVSVTSKFYNLSCQGQPRDTMVTLVNHPVLIKRSLGITAVVKPERGVDTNLNNNKVTQTDPNRMCVTNMVY